MTQHDLTAVVTGAAGGIGAALAKQMLGAGYRVISIDLEQPAFNHERLEAITLDLMDEEKVADAAQSIADTNSVTHFVHNAGVIRPNRIEDATVDDFIALTKLHIGSALIFMQAFAPSMKEQRFGRVVFNSSRSLLGMATRSAYSYSKSGMFGLMRTWALELGPFGVTVNMVAPGPILTNNFWDLVEKDSPQQQSIAQALPMRRLGEPDDVARAMMFFADPRNDFVTGQTLYVCGGASIASSFM